MLRGEYNVELLIYCNFKLEPSGGFLAFGMLLVALTSVAYFLCGGAGPNPYFSSFGSAVNFLRRLRSLIFLSLALSVQEDLNNTTEDSCGGPLFLVHTWWCRICL